MRGVVAVCSVVIIAALVAGVGLVTGLVLRHVVQTAPLWLAAGVSLWRPRVAAWLALPCFLFWLAPMIVIWLYLLDVAHLVNGHFSPVEIVMTIVVGLASAAGARGAARLLRPFSAMGAGLFVAGAALQLACFRLSFLPGIAHR